MGGTWPSWASLEVSKFSPNNTRWKYLTAPRGGGGGGRWLRATSERGSEVAADRVRSAAPPPLPLPGSPSPADILHHSLWTPGHGRWGVGALIEEEAVLDEVGLEVGAELVLEVGPAHEGRRQRERVLEVRLVADTPRPPSTHLCHKPFAAAQPPFKRGGGGASDGRRGRGDVGGGRPLESPSDTEGATPRCTGNGVRVRLGSGGGGEGVGVAVEVADVALVDAGEEGDVPRVPLRDLDQDGRDVLDLQPWILEGNGGGGWGEWRCRSRLSGSPRRRGNGGASNSGIPSQRRLVTSVVWP